MAPRANTWHRSEPPVGDNDVKKEPDRLASASSRSSMLSWQRDSSQLAGKSREPCAALSFSQQVAWIHRQGPLSRPALPDQMHFSSGPSRLSRGSQSWSAQTGPSQPRKPFNSRQWVRPEQSSPKEGLRQPATARPCATQAGTAAMSATAGRCAMSTNLGALGSSGGPPRLKPAGAENGSAGTASKASSDSSLASAASSVQVTSQGIDSTRPAGTSVPNSSALQPRSSLHYANSRNGLTLRRVSVSTKKAQRQQQHLIQHTVHQQPASQAHAHLAVSASSPGLKAASILQAEQQIPGHQTQISSRPPCTPPASSSAFAASPGQQHTGTHSQTPGRLPGSAAVKRKLPSSSTLTKRQRTAGRQIQSPSRSKKLQRLGNELYSSSGKGTLLRKGSKAVRKTGTRVSTDGSHPPAKVVCLPMLKALSHVRKWVQLGKATYLSISDFK